MRKVPCEITIKYEFEVTARNETSDEYIEQYIAEQVSDSLIQGSIPLEIDEKENEYQKDHPYLEKITLYKPADSPGFSVRYVTV